MEKLVCRLEPLDSALKGIHLPDGQEVIVGRSSEHNVQSIYVSRQQLALVADYRDQIVVVTACGRAESVVDSKVLNFGDSCFAGHGSVIELVKGSLKYRLIFSENRKRLMATEEAKTKKKFDSFFWEYLCANEVLLGTHPEYDTYKRKIAAFDLDGTLIKTKSGHTFPKSADDWMVWDDAVSPALNELHKNGYQVVIFTNQASLSMPKGKMLLKDFKKKVENIILALGVPACIYISTSEGFYRKPAPGMWELMKTRVPSLKINMVESFYVGDAAGRRADWKPGKKADFAASDRLFARNTQLKFLTPDEFFLKEPPVQYPDIKFHPNRYDDGSSLSDPEYIFPTEGNEVIIMVGSPGSGKSHFIRTHLSPRQYRPVSRDNLGTWQKCVAALKKHLESNAKVVIDNTNPDAASRQRFIEVCKEANVKVRCFLMTTSLDRCLHNNKYRQITDSTHQTVKSHLIKSFHSTLEPPTLEEGFSEIVKVPFVPLFEDMEYERIYNYYLLS